MRGTYERHVGSTHGEVNFDKAEDIMKSIHGPAFVGGSALLYTLFKMYDKRGTGKLDWKNFLLLALAFKAIQKGYRPAPKGYSGYESSYGPSDYGYAKPTKGGKIGKLINIASNLLR